ncbi:MAG: hypothetical protein PUA69_02230 [Erysipelotrichaceae bacterium]|nr:hypothetical protein [Erysipelotrichaceae bacterium]
MSDYLPGLFSILYQFELIAIRIMEPLLVSPNGPLEIIISGTTPFSCSFFEASKTSSPVRAKCEYPTSSFHCLCGFW